MESENITTNELSLFEVNPPQLDNGPNRARENMEKQVCTYRYTLQMYSFSNSIINSNKCLYFQIYRIQNCLTIAGFFLHSKVKT